MTKPLICISNASNHNAKLSPNATRQIVLSRAYADAIAAAGGVPVVTAEHCPEELSKLCDGLVLSGGEDIEPELFGETILNDTVVLDTERSEFEIPLIRAFMAEGKPILAICRGSQILSCLLGGDLWQDLAEQKNLCHMDKNLRHEVDCAEGSLLHRLFGGRFKVNSTHHQAVRTVAPGFWVTARSDEGIVEAFEHESLPIWATQFHPERLTGTWSDGRTQDFAPLFEFFVEKVRERQSLSQLR